MERKQICFWNHRGISLLPINGENPGQVPTELYESIPWVRLAARVSLAGCGRSCSFAIVTDSSPWSGRFMMACLPECKMMVSPHSHFQWQMVSSMVVQWPPTYSVWCSQPCWQIPSMTLIFELPLGMVWSEALQHLEIAWEKWGADWCHLWLSLCR